jgi:hypothetical protein
MGRRARFHREPLGTEVVHVRWVWVRFGLRTKNGAVEDNVYTCGGASEGGASEGG